MATETPPATAGAWSVRLALLALVLVLAGLLTTDLDAVDRGLVRGAIGRDLVRIAELATLRGASGTASPAATMPVMVTQEGGPPWLREEAEAAVEADPIFTRGEPHLLRVEVIELSRTYGVRAQLWRQGWSLRGPTPLWVTSATWTIVFAALAGAGVAAVRRRLVGGLLVAGGLGQALPLALPWPVTFPRPSLSQMWQEGPVGHAVVELARTLPDASVAVGAGVITLCAVLMVFDHRRSSDEGGGLLAAGLVGVLATLAWLEAALRAGLGPWLGQPAGWLALVGVLGLWVWAWRRRVPSSEVAS